VITVCYLADICPIVRHGEDVPAPPRRRETARGLCLDRGGRLFAGPITRKGDAVSGEPVRGMARSESGRSERLRHRSLDIGPPDPGYLADTAAPKDCMFTVGVHASLVPKPVTVG
jgi:hypothetical protein